MKYLLYASMALVVTIGTLRASDAVILMGTDWKTLTKPEKRMWVIGNFSGVVSGVGFTIREAHADNAVANRVIYKLIPKGASDAEIVASLDAFFAGSPENERLSVSVALIIVALAMGGSDSSTVEAERQRYLGFTGK
jgi:hypothetical protein